MRLVGSPMHEFGAFCSADAAAASCPVAAVSMSRTMPVNTSMVRDPSDPDHIRFITDQPRGEERGESDQQPDHHAQGARAEVPGRVHDSGGDGDRDHRAYREQAGQLAAEQQPRPGENPALAEDRAPAR